MILSNLPTRELLICASEPTDSVLRTAARKELDRRGVPYGSSSADKREMDARMCMSSRRGTSAPCVRRDGRHQIFGGVAQASSAPLRRDGHMHPEERAQMDARMGLKRQEPAVRRDGRVQTFELLTPEQARRAIRASAKK